MGKRHLYHMNSLHEMERSEILEKLEDFDMDEVALHEDLHANPDPMEPLNHTHEADGRVTPNPEQAPGGQTIERGENGLVMTDPMPIVVNKLIALLENEVVDVRLYANATGIAVGVRHEQGYADRSTTSGEDALRIAVGELTHLIEISDRI